MLFLPGVRLFFSRHHEHPGHDERDSSSRGGWQVGGGADNNFMDEDPGFAGQRARSESSFLALTHCSPKLLKNKGVTLGVTTTQINQELDQEIHPTKETDRETRRPKKGIKDGRNK